MLIQIDNEEEMAGYKKIDIDINLKDVAYPSQLLEIYAPTLLNHIALINVEKKLAEFYDYLRPTGRLIIGGVDCFILSKLCTAREISEIEYNNLLFNDPKFQAVHSLQKIKTILQNLGFLVDNISVQENNARFTIEVIK